MAIIDHKQRYRQRLLQQFKDKENLLGLIDSLIAGQGDLETVLDQLLTQRSIETAVGLQLDIIGEIVGQPRAILDVTGLEFFAYDGAAGDIDGYGTVLDSTKGARYRGSSEGLGTIKQLGDTEYRIFIKSKIFQNVGTITTENLIEAIVFMLGSGSIVNIIETPPAAATLTIVSKIPVTTAQLLVANDAFPRPTGVRYTVVFSSGDGNVFAFDTFPGGSGFGTVTNPALGGIFTEII